MISVETRYYAYLREITGVREERVVLEEGSTVATLIEKLVGKYGPRLRDYIMTSSGELRPNIAIAINDLKIPDEPLRKALKDGDRVVIIPPIAGGIIS
ncbi:MAG: ubiquitin-like small modifier protein 1 [Nitrososphaerota archaeon]